jgi:small subunit ribosomal protein S36
MEDLRLRSLGRPLAAITLLHLTLLLTWSVMVPTFRGADEHVHHDFLRHLTETWRYPEYDGLDVSRRTLDALGTSPAFPAHAAAVAADTATPRADRPGWSDLGPDVRNGPPNQMPQHPPLYYEATAAVLRALDGDGRAPLDLAVWQLRLLNVLVMVPLPLLAADIARRFTRQGPVVLAAAAATLAVPQLTHIGATVSNDPLMTVLGSITLAGAARLVTGDRRWTTAAVTGVAAGLALFTKGFAIPLVPAVALACLLPLLGRRRAPLPAEPGSEPGNRRTEDGVEATWRNADDNAEATGRNADDNAEATGRNADDNAEATGRNADDGAEATASTVAAASTVATASSVAPASTADTGDERPEVAGTVARAGLVAALALAFGGWWWIRNVVAYGTPQPGVRLRDRVPGVELDLLRFAGDFGERLVGSFWGHFGWREAHLPLGISIAMTLLVVAAAAVACWGHWPRVVLVLPTIAASAMVLSSGWGAFKKTGVSYATQGRYLFAGIAGLAVLVSLGVARIARRRGISWQPLVTLVVALALQALGLWVSLERYWAGAGFDRVRALTRFAPLPGPATAAILAATGIAAVAAMVALAPAAAPRRGSDGTDRVTDATAE